MAKEFCVDFDDYCDNTAHTLEDLVHLKEKYPDFKVTLFAIPKRCSEETINRAKKFPWIQLAPHGWRHTRGECLSWTDEEAENKIKMAKEMGIDAPLFRAPAWLIDGDTYIACEKLEYIVCAHKHYNIPGNKQYIYNSVNMNNLKRRGVHGHLSNVSGNYIKDMIQQGRLNFPEDAVFLFPQETL